MVQILPEHKTNLDWPISKNIGKSVQVIGIFFLKLWYLKCSLICDECPILVTIKPFPLI